MFNNYHGVNISRISNGYTVSVPNAPKFTDSVFSPCQNTPGLPNAHSTEDNFFIPTNKNIFFFESLEKVFDYLKSIEKNIPVDSYNPCVTASPCMVG